MPDSNAQPGITPPLEQALLRVGDRWSLLVVDALLGGAQRFADLEAGIPGIATNILSARLKHLERERLVLAVPYSRRPRRYAYELTDAGQDLAGALRLLAQWGADHSAAADSSDDSADAAPRHQRCGTALEARWWCPTCGELAEDEPDGTVWV
ncbi:MAG: helix-turn-helix transcriptional regulator [Acidimicrobiaceae bacterium]|nr:helix-turn-helix transcriptional regulator [Acidimicrobiaceae bacterium]